jgi:hypothetical protein
MRTWFWAESVLVQMAAAKMASTNITDIATIRFPSSSPERTLTATLDLSSLNIRRSLLADGS